MTWSWTLSSVQEGERDGRRATGWRMRMFSWGASELARGRRVSIVFGWGLSSFVLAGSSGPWQYFAVDVAVFPSLARMCFDTDSVCLGPGRGPLPALRAHHWWPGLSAAHFSRVSFEQQFFRWCCYLLRAKFVGSAAECWWRGNGRVAVPSRHANTAVAASCAALKARHVGERSITRACAFSRKGSSRLD